MLWRRTHCTGCCSVVQHASVRITAIQLDSLHFFFRLGKVKIISHIAGSWHEDCSRSLWVWCHRQTLMDSVPLVLNSFNPRQLLTVQYYWSRMNTNCSSLSQRKKHTLSCFFWGWDPLKKRGYAPSRIPRISLPFSAALFNSVPRPPNHQRTPLLLSRMSRMTYSYRFNCWLAPAIAL